MVSAEAGTTPPVAGTTSSFSPTIDADGQLVAFVTKATNLQLVQAGVGGDAADGDVLLFDAASGRLTRLSVSTDGVRPAVGAHARPHLSETGRDRRVRHAGRRRADRRRAAAGPQRRRAVEHAPV